MNIRKIENIADTELDKAIDVLLSALKDSIADLDKFQEILETLNFFQEERIQRNGKYEN